MFCNVIAYVLLFILEYNLHFCTSYPPHFILLQSYFLTNIYEWVETEAYYISSYNKAMRYKKNSRNQQRAAGAKTYFL